MKETNKKLQPSKGMDLRLISLHLFSFGLMALIVRNAMQLENVETELSFYWMYHSNPWNQLIHFFFVPTLVWTLCIILVHAELAPITLNLPFLPTHRFNHVTVWLILGSWLYLKIDKIGGTLYLPIIYAMYGSALWLREEDQKESHSTSWAGTGTLFRWPVILHIASWAIQIYGHSHFEHGRPALLDSFGQALTIAPLFAFYEGLWVLGINMDLRQRILAEVAVLSKDVCTPEAAMHVCKVMSSS